MAIWNTDKPAIADTIAADIPDIEENFQELHDVIEQITNGTLGTTEPAAFSVDAVTGYKTIYIPAGALIPTTTNGAAYGLAELATNDVMKEYYSFDATTEEFVCVEFPMPEDWDRSTVKAKFFWSGASGCTAADTVEWQIAGQAVSNDDAMDVAFGDAGEVITDAVLGGTFGDLCLTSATPAVTVGGTPALADLVQWKVSRNVAGTDDMAEDALLFGVWIQYQVTNKPAAW